MATFADAVNALVAERDSQFVQRIATDYNLNLEELQAKYLAVAEMAIKVPRKYVKKPKSVEVVGETGAKVPKAAKAAKEKQCCTAHTSKKEPCKFSALKGEVFCKRHLKQSIEEAGEPKAKEPKAKKEPKKAAKKPDQPVHTHRLNEEAAACDLCESHGNAFGAEEQDFEIVMPQPSGPAAGPVKQVTVAQRLAAMLEEADSEEEDEDAPLEETESDCEEGEKLDAAFEDYEEEN
jgi:hypothetical protein